jgi:hypothetical protein
MSLKDILKEMEAVFWTVCPFLSGDIHDTADHLVGSIF